MAGGKLSIHATPNLQAMENGNRTNCHVPNLGRANNRRGTEVRALPRNSEKGQVAKSWQKTAWMTAAKGRN
jgi:hypothetical protein